MITNPPTGNTELLGRYHDYEAAQELIDALADKGFPVEHVSVIGDDLKVIEQVTGRLTIPRAAGIGALRGAAMGIIIALVLDLAIGLTLFGVLLLIVIASLAAAASSGIAHAALRGQRDFTSERHIAAGSYAVIVDARHASEAKRLLAPAAPDAPSPGTPDPSPKPRWAVG